MTPISGISKKKINLFTEKLLNWATKNLRVFPWRRTTNSYHILIAETMLQRTKAEQVVPIFDEFIKAFPSPKSLAESNLKEIENCIKSLGLIKRATGLKRLANQIVSNYGGCVPDSRNDLLSLFGVGNYIANAVLCHAYGEELPTVDANFARVLKRVFTLELKKPEQKDPKVWLLAEKILVQKKGDCRNLNLSIIDLANLICVPRNPKCPICPLYKICNYAQTFRQLGNTCS